MPEDERKAKAAAVSVSRFLTQDEFKKIRAAQMAKEIKAAPGKAEKRKNIEIDSDGEEGFVLPYSDYIPLLNWQISVLV